ncbi:zinc finger protein with KRAB and SCAN domains 1-like isoform X2 [Pantherophis guttatus]|uniref:Zinc finger protein with KRAB and SCAN domains 1-like isoform X2 n=1 Tax=Pantherophis guttatus TaxID=94885 RepID=A0A6P9BIC0_PANGU|nr:zinc finger protein with KRAB and SCAN domains 1-like isoform X2 [Pantherophis guttatus]
MGRAKLRKKRGLRHGPENKMELAKKGGLRDDTASLQSKLGLGVGPQPSLAPQAGGMGGFLEMPHQQEDQSMHNLWETQFQEFLKDTVFEKQLLDDLTPWEDPRAFLASFEKVAVACRWPRKEWVTRLLPALSEEAEKAFIALSAEDREDYWKVKSAILHREAAFREKQRQEFRRFCFQEAEGPRQVLARLQELFCQWLRAERSSKEQILELLLLEQFLNILPREMQNWVKERTPDTCLEAVGLAEEFLRRLQTAEKGEEQEPEEPKAQPEMASMQSPTNTDSQQQQIPPLPPQLYPGYKQTNVSKKKKLQWGHFGDVKLRAVFPGRANSCRWRQGRDIVVQPRRHSERLRKSHLPIQVEMLSSTPRKVKPKPKERPPPASGTPKDQIKHCEECGRDFNGIASFFRHRIRHTGEKRYECCFCGRGFCWRSDLVRHECLHTGKKPHECSYCGEGFDRKWLRVQHQQTHLQNKTNL